MVDPADQGQQIYGALQKNGFRVAGILLTHGHFDHIWGLDALRDAANAAAEADGLEAVKAYAHEDERALLKDVHMNVSEQAGRACSTYADVYVKDGQEITLAGMTCKVIATPGHTAEAAVTILRRQECWWPEIHCLPNPWDGRIFPRAAWALWCGPYGRSCLCCRRIRKYTRDMGTALPSDMR